MVHGKPLAYLDNGASAQRPNAVIGAVDDFERRHHANIHRGVHTLSQEATALYEGARDSLVRFINARSRRELVFVRGTTEAINLVAQSFARPLLKAGDEVLITHLEHHANIVPWQMVCEQTGACCGSSPWMRAARFTWNPPQRCSARAPVCSLARTYPTRSARCCPCGG